MDYILHYVAPFGLSMLIVIVLVPVWISICKKWSLFDEPDSRKHHVHLTPSMGGIAIFAGIFISYLSFAVIEDTERIRFLLGGVLILFFTGFFDDLMEVPAKNKLLLQIGSAAVVFAGGYRIESLGGFLGLYEIPFAAQLPLTLFMIVAFTNAFNFIDGIDGLAASLGLVMLGTSGMLFLDFGRADYAMLCFCVCGALAGFLLFNASPAKIFMGDTGSLVIGFVTAVMAVRMTSLGGPTFAVHPSAILAIVFVPLYDISRVLVIRFLNGASPFQPDRNHLHHTILRFGFGHTSATMLIIFMALLVMALQFVLEPYGIIVFGIAALTLCMLLVNTRTLTALVRMRESLNPAWKEGRRKMGL